MANSCHMQEPTKLDYAIVYIIAAIIIVAVILGLFAGLKALLL